MDQDGADKDRDTGSERLTARPTLTGADKDAAEDRVGVEPEDHLAAGKADAIDHGTSGGEPRPRPGPSRAGEGEI
jgi:hypothetical protein